MLYREYDEFIAGTSVFDDANKSLDKIQKELLELITDDIDEEKKRLLTWEGQLFICCEIPLEQRNEGQQFLFPQEVYNNGVKIPDIDNFEAERLDFYKHRFEMVINVPAKIRYANYCFQYCEKNQKYKYAMQICQLLCEYLKNIAFGHECITSFSRLFELVLSFSNKDAIEKLDGVVDELISRNYSQEDYLYLLSISRIVARNIAKNKNDFIKAETQEKLVSIIEEMSDYYFQRGDYPLYRNCCPNYMDWLKILKRQDEIYAVLLKIGESYELEANKEGKSNLEKAEFYQLAAKHYANIGEREKVYYLKVKIKNAFKDAGSSGEFKTISTTQSVPLKQLEKETKDFFKENIEDTLVTVSHCSDWNNRGVKSIVWRCISRLEATGLECHARTVNETVLENVVVQAINQLLGDKSTYQAQLQQNIAKAIRDAQKTAADGIDEQLMELQKELLKKANNKEAYDEIAEQIFKLREQRQQCTVDTAARDAQIARITELQDFIKEQCTDLAEFDESLVKRWFKQITVWNDHFTVGLKSGLSIDIEG